jgi:hypothetical protein
MEGRIGSLSAGARAVVRVCSIRSIRVCFRVGLGTRKCLASPAALWLCALLSALLVPRLSSAGDIDGAILMQRGYFREAISAGMDVGETLVKERFPVVFSLSETIANRGNVTVSVSSVYALYPLQPKGKKIFFTAPYLDLGVGGHALFGFADLGDYGLFTKWVTAVKFHAICGAEFLNYKNSSFFFETRYTYPSTVVLDYFSLGIRFKPKPSP